jgi:DNA invertase Pin-like site-specific DNA recombinase
LPDANTLTIGIFAVVAQHEREIISARIKDALAAKKARGFALGTPKNLTTAAITRGRTTRIENARNNPKNRQAYEFIKHSRKEGLTFAIISQRLNDLGYVARRDKGFCPGTVERLFKRFSHY